jgi:hypothetical protein
MVDQNKILQNLLDFYKKKKASTSEARFINAVSDLVKEGDIEESVFLDFCEKNGIGGDVPKSSKKSKLPPINRRITPFTDYDNTPNRDYGNSRCGGGDTPNRTDYGSSRC